LIDYEKICDDKGARLIAFGRYAGIAGTIDYLAGFGQFILTMGYSSPFLYISIILLKFVGASNRSLKVGGQRRLIKMRRSFIHF